MDANILLSISKFKNTKEIVKISLERFRTSMIYSRFFFPLINKYEGKFKKQLIITM